MEDAEVLDLSKSRAAKQQHDDYVTWVWDQFTRMKSARAVVERQWYLNLAFYFGRQYVAPIPPGRSGYSSTTTRLWIPSVPPWRARPVINRIRKTIRTEIAQLTNNKPNATVVPASAEDRDMYAAMAAEQVWNSTYTEKKVKAIIRRAVWWNQVCGNSYIKTWWDFTKGNTIKDEAGLPVLDAQKQFTYEGDICFIHETPFHVFVPDLLEEEIEDQPYVFHAKTRSPEYIQMKYKIGLDGKEVKAVETTGREILEESFLNLIGNNSTQNKQRSVIEFEVWIKPGQHPKFPEGAMFTVVGNQIVQGYGQLPYSHKQYPFAKLDNVPAGKYYASSAIEDLIPLQKEYNRTHGQIIENKNRMSKIQLLYERGAVDPTKITTEPGQAVPYTPGFAKPDFLQPPNLPPYVVQTLDRILQDWNDIAGQHEVTQGQVPPGVTAATAISFLQERDESTLTPTFDSLEESIEKIARQALVLIHDYWTVEKIIKITGPDGSFDSMAFKGSDLGENLDIRIEAGSALPTSKAAQRAWILDLMKMGFVNPDDGLEVLDMGGMVKIYERVQADRRQIQRENLRMSKATAQILQQYQEQNDQLLEQNPEHFGTTSELDEVTGEEIVFPLDPPLLVSTNSWDNHQAHILFHNQYRKGQAFENLDQATKDLFEAHVREHIEALGIESETMEPRVAAGLPPVPIEEEQSENNSKPPGPQSMPEMEIQ